MKAEAAVPGMRVRVYSDFRYSLGTVCTFKDLLDECGNYELGKKPPRTDEVCVRLDNIDSTFYSCWVYSTWQVSRSQAPRRKLRIVGNELYLEE